MRIIHQQAAGLDVHKKSGVAATTAASGGRTHAARRTFGTMTSDLLAFSDWLTAQGVSQVAMESTGEFWKPVFNVL